jgi:hypothetical protein
MAAVCQVCEKKRCEKKVNCKSKVQSKRAITELQEKEPESAAGREFGRVEQR